MSSGVGDIVEIEALITKSHIDTLNWCKLSTIA